MLDQAVFRIALAGLIGIIIGWFSRSEPGARLFALVCMGTALLAVVSTEYFSSLVLPGGIDPGRLSAQVIKALGFIGSGLTWHAVTQEAKRKEVRGISTAATMWLTAILGLLIGVGMSATTAGAVMVIMIMLFLNYKLDVEKLLGTKDKGIYIKTEQEKQ